jgi:hypothetical protein
VASIVEGHGELEAVPILIRRLAPELRIARPVRVKRQQITIGGSLAHAARIAEANVREGGGKGGVLLLLDADNDCPASLGPELQRQLSTALGHRLVRSVLAVRAFESWLIAGMDSAPEFPDEDRGGKAWLKAKFGRYSPTADQPCLAAHMRIERAQQCSRSFRRLVKVIQELASEARRVE